MSAPSSAPPHSHHRRHSSRKTQARWQLLGVLVVAAAAYGLLFSFAFNRWQPFIGGLFGASATTLLLAGMVWNRQNWARYVLITVLLGVAGAAGLCLVTLLGIPEEAHGPHIPMVSGGIFGLMIAAGWLMFSSRISYLTTPSGSGG